MISLNNLGEVSAIKSGTGVIAAENLDAANFNCCSGNRMIIRTRIVSPTNPFILTAFIPLKPPCCYNADIRWTGQSDNGSILCARYVFQLNQVTSGGPLGQTELLNGSIASVGAPSMVISKNATLDAMDIVLNTLIGGTITSELYIDIHSNDDF